MHLVLLFTPAHVEEIDAHLAFHGNLVSQNMDLLDDEAGIPAQQPFDGRQAVGQLEHALQLGPGAAFAYRLVYLRLLDAAGYLGGFGAKILHYRRDIRAIRHGLRRDV